MSQPELREFTCDVCTGTGETNNGTCFQCKGSGVVKEWVYAPAGYWACVFCGNPVEEHGMGSLCCGEVNHTEWVEDEPE